MIVINTAVFVLDEVAFDSKLKLLGYFSRYAAIDHLQFWRFITFQFLHADLGHLIFNMISLYSFGKFVEAVLGRVRYFAFYLICGVAGAAGYLLLAQLQVLVSSPFVPMVGASAGVFGVLIGAARVAPNLQMQLLFPPVVMNIRTMAWCFVGIAVITIATQMRNAGGEAAHLGGAAMGALLISNPGLLKVFAPRPKKQSCHFKSIFIRVDIMV